MKSSTWRLFSVFVAVNLVVAATANQCLLEPEVGPCRAAIPKWYFDKTTKMCAVFSWGGCGGVVPFQTEKECVAAKCTEQSCVQDPDAGPCEAAIPKWFFNKTSGACEEFIYGGCAGLVPFDTEDECVSAQCNPNCTRKPESGFCLARFIRWFFNPTTAKCQSFVWGGCGGSVPFQTLRECQAAKCKVEPPPSPSPLPAEERCMQIPDPGPCRGSFNRWFWNKKTGSHAKGIVTDVNLDLADGQTCESFVYGGCLGTVPFQTYEECQQAKCGRSQCVIKKQDILSSIGPITCAAFWTSWYYNKKTGKCESFSYSACSNLGPFESAKECKEARCRVKLCAFGKPSLTEGCELGNLKETWYFDLETRQCNISSGDKCTYGEVFQSNMECRRARCRQVLCDMTKEDVTYQPRQVVCGPPPMPWVFNEGSGRCEQFEHVGCEKRLPFTSMFECKKKCMKNM